MKCLLCGDRTFLDKEGFCSFKCEGAYEERERIIKLLEGLSFTVEKVEHTPELAYAIDRGIALIKGEK